MNYKVTLNFHGENHELFTNASNTVAAIRNAQFQLANKLGINHYTVRQHIFSGDKVKVEKVEE